VNVIGQCVPGAGGAAFGLLVSVPLMASLRHYLYDVAPTDWMAYTVAALALSGVAGVAVLLPVWRALRVDRRWCCGMIDRSLKPLRDRRGS
jgi:hypothetical protein